MNAEVKFILQEIERNFIDNADATNASKMEAYLKNMFKLYGIKSPLRKELLKPLHKEVKQLDADDFRALLKQLWSKEQRDYQYAAMDFLQKNKKKLDSSDVQMIEDFISTKSWWDSVDMLASHMAGHLLKSDIELRDKWISKWMASGNMWLQRTCLIFQLKYAKKTDFDLLKANVLELKHINEFFIQKAIGWSLRQYARFDPSAVQEFVGENDDFSNLARREALKHFL